MQNSNIDDNIYSCSYEGRQLYKIKDNISEIEFNKRIYKITNDIQKTIDEFKNIPKQDSIESVYCSWSKMRLFGNVYKCNTCSKEFNMTCGTCPESQTSIICYNCNRNRNRNMLNLAISSEDIKLFLNTYFMNITNENFIIKTEDKEFIITCIKQFDKLIEIYNKYLNHNHNYNYEFFNFLTNSKQNISDFLKELFNINSANVNKINIIRNSKGQLIMLINDNVPYDFDIFDFCLIYNNDGFEFKSVYDILTKNGEKLHIKNKNNKSITEHISLKKKKLSLQEELNNVINSRLERDKSVQKYNESIIKYNASVSIQAAFRGKIKRDRERADEAARIAAAEAEKERLAIERLAIEEAAKQKRIAAAEKKASEIRAKEEEAARIAKEEEAVRQEVAKQERIVAEAAEAEKERLAIKRLAIEEAAKQQIIAAEEAAKQEANERADEIKRAVKEAEAQQTFGPTIKIILDRVIGELLSTDTANDIIMTLVKRFPNKIKNTTYLREYIKDYINNHKNDYTKEDKIRDKYLKADEHLTDEDIYLSVQVYTSCGDRTLSSDEEILFRNKSKTNTRYSFCRLTKYKDILQQYEANNFLPPGCYKDALDKVQLKESNTEGKDSVLNMWQSILSSKSRYRTAEENIKKHYITNEYKN